MDTLLQAESPDLVLTGTSTPDDNNRHVIEQTTTLAARNRGITTLAVLDFWTKYSLRFSDISSGVQLKFLPDKLAIMDKYAESDMLAEGFPEDILVITGNPHFNNLEAKAREFSGKEGWRQQIGLDTEVLCFYAACVWKHEESKLGYWDLHNIQLANGVLRELPEPSRFGLVVKLHPRVPREDLEEISDYIQNESDGRIKLTDISPSELILASDLTLTPYSTLGIEAVYIGKPCISIQPGLLCEDFLAVLTKNNLIPVGYNHEDCKCLVERAYTDSNYREGLIDQASDFRTDGKATDRVTNLVYELLEIT